MASRDLVMTRKAGKGCKLQGLRKLVVGHGPGVAPGIHRTPGAAKKKSRGGLPSFLWARLLTAAECRVASLEGSQHAL